MISFSLISYILSIYICYNAKSFHTVHPIFMYLLFGRWKWSFDFYPECLKWPCYILWFIFWTTNGFKLYKCNKLLNTDIPLEQFGTIIMMLRHRKMIHFAGYRWTPFVTSYDNLIFLGVIWYLQKRFVTILLLRKFVYYFKNIHFNCIIAKAQVCVVLSVHEISNCNICHGVLVTS